MATFNHTTIERMNAKSLIAALGYYNNRIFNKNTITFTMFVERCVEENKITHHINIHYNDTAEGELAKYGFTSEDGNVITIEQAEKSFNSQVAINHAFYHLFASEEEKIINVLNKAQKPVKW